MTYDPADKRALFQRVVDDLTDQIRDGRLRPGERLPSAKEISDRWDVSAMTSQRALRELQALGLSYGMAGKGTFVHPDAPQTIKILDGQPAASPAGPTVSAGLAQYLLTRDAFAAKTVEWMENLRDKTRAAELQAEMNLLAAVLEGQRQGLDQDEIDRYQAELAAAAGPAASTATQPPADGDTPKLTRRRSHRK
ncbi:GntR family transcriptional regulator [Luedemannella helvata]|uniref:HTH gntR-type domain-containing protein n=1 Tax=Luedemannella helvata TaxID=349315 RepID=A0ABP4WYA3_9ACTN